MTDQQYRNKVADELDEYAKTVRGVLVAASMREAARLLRTPSRRARSAKEKRQ